MSIDDAMNWLPGLSDEQLKHVGAPATANKDPSQYLDYLNTIKEVDAIDISKFRGEMFQPEPTHWKHIRKLPPFLQKAWIKSVKDELRTQFRIETFKIQPRPHGAKQVDVTLKFRAKQKADGFIDKLKARMCLRGDQQRERSDFDTCISAVIQAG